MNDINPLERIRGLCAERNWTYYQLSKASGIPYSTLNTMLHKDNMPSLPTLHKLGRGFVVSVADFFEPGRNLQGLTDEQSQCLSLFTSLSPSDQQLALAFMKGLAKKLN